MSIKTIEIAECDVLDCDAWYEVDEGMPEHWLQMTFHLTGLRHLCPDHVTGERIDWLRETEHMTRISREQGD